MQTNKTVITLSRKTDIDQQLSGHGEVPRNEKDVLSTAYLVQSIITSNGSLLEHRAVVALHSLHMIHLKSLPIPPWRQKQNA